MNENARVSARRWTVDVLIGEHDGHSHAEARLHTQDRTHLVGHGIARLSPRDHDVPEIGEELAVSRALADLATQLREAAAGDIEGVTQEHVSLRS